MLYFLCEYVIVCCFCIEKGFIDMMKYDFI